MTQIWSWNHYYLVMKRLFGPSWNFLVRHEFKFWSWNFSPSWITTSWRHELHSLLHEFYSIRHESTHLVLVMKYFTVMNHILVMKSFTVMIHYHTSWNTFHASWNLFPTSCIITFSSDMTWVRVLNAAGVAISTCSFPLFPSRHHTFQAQHQRLQFVTIFIDCFLWTELLLVLCIVTPVSLARTGGGIRRRIVQFWTLFGGQTSRASAVFGGLVSVFRAWAVFSHALELPGALSSASG